MSEKKVRIQKSSGGVIYREEAGQLWVVLISPHSDRWALPKGIVERGEDPAQTAVREVAEETGLGGELVDKLGYVEYWYRDPKDKILYHKFVDFFLIRYQSGDVSQHDWEVQEARWLPITEAIAQASYDSEKNILIKAKEAWEKIKSARQK